MSHSSSPSTRRSSRRNSRRRRPWSGALVRQPCTDSPSPLPQRSEDRRDGLGGSGQDDRHAGMDTRPDDKVGHLFPRVRRLGGAQGRREQHVGPHGRCAGRGCGWPALLLPARRVPIPFLCGRPGSRITGLVSEALARMAEDFGLTDPRLYVTFWKSAQTLRVKPQPEPGPDGPLAVRSQDSAEDRLVARSGHRPLTLVYGRAQNSVWHPEEVKRSTDGHGVRQTGQRSQLRGGWLVVTTVGDAVAGCAHHCPHVLWLVNQATEALWDGIDAASNALTQTLAQLLIDDHAQPVGELVAAVHAEPLREEVNVAWIHAVQVADPLKYSLALLLEFLSRDRAVTVLGQVEAFERGNQCQKPRLGAHAGAQRGGQIVEEGDVGGLKALPSGEQVRQGCSVRAEADQCAGVVADQIGGFRGRGVVG